ncbi:Disease resistance protein RGA2 [Dichanthelium oligosanthes]|uniref:Disease resistance protein RGA2 n=1 Tax=Dichanthelium oligosanthes TaxID=888268 RepID=A0A1E5V4Z3_9POAL|nr:Disease resistance protein RGA2 [Dichanthelium oligosanthes]
MAELVVGPLVSMVKEKASSYLLDQYRVMEGMEEQRKILERQLPAILDIIQDAEEKGSFRPGVAAWLKDLKAVAYEANDVFDEFKYEALLRDAKKKGHHRRKFGMEVVRARNSIVFRYRMGRKLRRIVQTIEVLVTHMNTFGFRQQQQAPPSNQWRKTDPIMVDSDKNIVRRSRNEEMLKITRILLKEASNMDLMVLPIVGMGGLGKTTFAQLIYNDPAIEKHFELRRWCCVSDDFDVSTIASNICQINKKGREKALKELQSIISGKRYLIVLDDVWNRDVDKWGKLKTCLKRGGKGSAVLTTTRDAEVARIMTMGVPEAHNIEKLSDEHLKEIVLSRAFSLQNLNSNEVDVIVDGIVHRCAGSPLAAKAFGSMLSTKTHMNEWKDILAKSDICNERTGILPILKLSFDDLPSHMKQCFAFCAIFPKDYEIDVEVLIQLWMAHDFIPVQEDNHPETVGAEIFEELTWRSFFQDVKHRFPIANKRRLSLRKRTICKIHDLMHDIALSVMGKECTTIVDKPSMKKLLPNPTRHIFLSIYSATLLDDFLKKQSTTLQTFLCPDFYDYIDIPKYTSLRALHIPARTYLPGQVQHLRYLDLSETWWLKQLPEDISIMYNLQTLNVSYCINLHQLPRDMKYMASLRHLYTNGCESLTCMPPGLGQMTSLQTLTYFVVGASLDCSTIGELRDLNLGGELELSGLENVTEALATAASLENKEKLTHLYLKWNDDACEKPDCHNKEVLDALKPNRWLELLRIESYKGTSLPSWTTDLSLLKHLTVLHLIGCMLCEEFPQFCHFKALQSLYLEKLYKLRNLCSDVASMPFPALKELQLHDLESLERWVAIEGKEDELTFPVLEEVDIENCPKLTSLPEAPKLKVIRLDEGKAQLSLEIVKSKHMSSLSKLELSICDAQATAQIDLNRESSLSELSLSGCDFFFSSPSQTIFGVWEWFEQLVDLSIQNCNVLIYWPEQVFQSLVSLKKLWIGSCNKLIGPTQISSCDNLVTLPNLPPSLRELRIQSCQELCSMSGQLDALETLYINDCRLKIREPKSWKYAIPWFRDRVR